MTHWDNEGKRDQNEHLQPKQLKDKKHVKREPREVTKNPKIKELTQMFKKMGDMQQDLKERLEGLYAQGGTQVDISKYLNLYNLTSQQVENLIEKQKELDIKIKKIIKGESCVLKLSRTDVKLTQERKGKLRGARNKWIPIR